MYQSHDMMSAHPSWVATGVLAEQMPKAPIAGAAPVKVAAALLNGVWMLRFGRFGCPESETRGGVVVVAGGELLGCDDNFAYRGEWTLDGTELTALLHISRHVADTDLPTIFGTLENDYQIECVAEAITPDLFEGRLRRPGHPDARVIMRRLSHIGAMN